MKSTELVSNLVLLAVVACVAAGALPAAGAGFDSTTQSESLELSVTDKSSDTITVDIATGASDVAGLETNVTFDPSLVRVVSVDGVDLGNPVTNVDNERGWVFISQAQASGVDHPTTTRITFEVVGDGAVTLDFVDADTSLFDSESSTIPVSTAGTTADTTQSDGGDTGERDGDSGGDDDRSDETRPGDDDDDAGTYGEDANDESSDGATDENANEAGTETDQTDQDGDGSDDGQPAGAGSSFVANLGIVVVLVGIILAIAVLAIDQR